MWARVPTLRQAFRVLLRDDERSHVVLLAVKFPGEVVVGLHRKPRPCRADTGAFETNGEIRADACVPLDHTTEGDTRDTEARGSLRDGETELLPLHSPAERRRRPQ